MAARKVPGVVTLTPDRWALVVDAVAAEANRVHGVVGQVTGTARTRIDALRSELVEVAAEISRQIEDAGTPLPA